MTNIIAVSGKGGVGKTMISTLLVRWLVNARVGSILAIDADPDSNFPESLGVGVEKTIGDIREELLDVTLPPGMEKRKWLDAKVFEITEEMGDFDLLVMGRPEGPGCYCAANHMLREIIDNAVEAYDFVVIDCEAGLEHLSRRTTQDVDIMLVVSDPSKKGFETASRIKCLAEELNIKFDYIFLILNRINKKNKELMNAAAKKTNLKVIGEIPEDDIAKEYDLAGRAIYSLPKNSGAYQAMGKVLGTITGIAKNIK